MKVRPILNLLGIGLVYFSFFQLLPIAISLIYEENNFTDYSGAFFITLITGIAFWVATYKEKQETIRIKENIITARHSPTPLREAWGYLNRTLWTSSPGSRQGAWPRS